MFCVLGLFRPIKCNAFLDRVAGCDALESDRRVAKQKSPGWRCFACIQCQRFSHPRRQNKATMPIVVAAIMPSATSEP